MKKSPFTVPERYFEDFAGKMRPWETAAGQRGSVARRVLRVCAVASAAAVIVAGVLLSPELVRDEDMDMEDSYFGFLYSDLVSEADPELLFIPGEDLQEDAGSDSVITEDDIVEYLITSGTSIEETLQLLAAGESGQ